MKRWAVILGLAGGLWMVFVLYSQSLPLARVSNYPRVSAGERGCKVLDIACVHNDQRQSV
jgi:hypothetical protein